MNLIPIGNKIIIYNIIAFVCFSLIYIKIVSIYKKVSIRNIFKIIIYKKYYKYKYSKKYRIKNIENYKGDEDIQKSDLYINLKKYIGEIEIYNNINLDEILISLNKSYVDVIKDIKVYYYIINKENKRKFILFNHQIDDRIKKILSSQSICYIEIENENIDIIKLVYKIKSYFINGVLKK